MNDLLWLLTGFVLGLPSGVFGGYWYADRRTRALPLLPHPALNSDEESP